MKNYAPNMTAEVLESIHLMFEDNPEVEVDCLLFLSKLDQNLDHVIALSTKAHNTLKDQNRCVNCGEKLETYFHKENHRGVDGDYVEEIGESFCPNCDVFPYEDDEDGYEQLRLY